MRLSRLTGDENDAVRSRVLSPAVMRGVGGVEVRREVADAYGAPLLRREEEVREVHAAADVVFAGPMVASPSRVTSSDAGSALSFQRVEVDVAGRRRSQSRHRCRRRDCPGP